MPVHLPATFVCDICKKTAMGSWVIDLNGNRYVAPEGWVIQKPKPSAAATLCSINCLMIYKQSRSASEDLP